MRSIQIAVIVLATATSLSSVSVQAAEWNLYFQNGSGVSFYFDASSAVRNKGAIVRAWEKQEWKTEDPILGKGFFWLIEVDCQQRSYTYKEITPISGTAESIKQIPIMKEMYAGTNYFSPNDLDEARYSVFCKNTGAKSSAPNP